MRNPFRRQAKAGAGKARPRDASPAEAAQQFAEIWGEAMVAARHLRIGTALLAALCLVMAAGWCSSAGRTVKPIIIRVDEIGRAEAVRYEALEASPTPQDPATLYFLHAFIHDHFTRNPATVRDRWTRSLAFLSPPQARAVLDRDSPEIALVSRRPVSEVTLVEELLLRIEPATDPPWKAVADFELADYEGGRERGRERWTASMLFSFADPDPGMITLNPLGLFILQVDAAPALDLRSAQ